MYVKDVLAFFVPRMRHADAVTFLDACIFKRSMSIPTGTPTVTSTSAPTLTSTSTRVAGRRSGQENLKERPNSTDVSEQSPWNGSWCECHNKKLFGHFSSGWPRLTAIYASCSWSGEEGQPHHTNTLIRIHVLHIFPQGQAMRRILSPKHWSSGCVIAVIVHKNMTEFHLACFAQTWHRIIAVHRTKKNWPARLLQNSAGTPSRGRIISMVSTIADRHDTNTGIP